MKRVVLIDDHPLFCEALTALLTEDPEIVVLGAAGEARTAYDLVARADPDVVTVDLGLPGTNGVAVVRELLRRQPRRRVLMLTMHDGAWFVEQAFSAGVIGYALKSQQAIEIREAVDSVAAGRRYLAPALRARSASRDVADGPLGMLTARELEIFDMLVRGLDNADVARELAISVKTVETHRTHIMKKLRMHSLAEMTRFAMRHQLVSSATSES
jgi:two-component system NarL family response regulator